MEFQFVTEPGSLGHFEDGARQPQTLLKMEPGSLGHFYIGDNWQGEGP